MLAREQVLQAFRTVGVGSQDGPPDDDWQPPSEIPENAGGEPDHEPVKKKSIAVGLPPKIEIETLPPLTLGEWRDRDLAEPDFIMGHWLSTTSRVLLTAATGLGRTNFGL